MKIKAAVLTAPRAPLQVLDVDLEDPGPGQVRVRMLATGVCRSDLQVINGQDEHPLPVVMGHEGAGEIDAVGPGVPESRIGERVVLAWGVSCGDCRQCREGRANLCAVMMERIDLGFLWDGTQRLSVDGQALHHFGFVSSWATHLVTTSNAAIPVTASLPAHQACLIGCAVPTGTLAVTHRAGVRPGESVAVFGCGGVGLLAIQGARLVSADPVIAIDPLASKREFALSMGATHAIDPTEGDVGEAIRAIVPDGVDYAFDVAGVAAEPAFESIRVGGTVVLVGLPGNDVTTPFPNWKVVYHEPTITGGLGGGQIPATHFPQLAALALKGDLDLEAMVTHRFGLDAINEAVEVAQAGAAARVVIDFE